MFNLNERDSLVFFKRIAKCFMWHWKASEQFAQISGR